MDKVAFAAQQLRMLAKDNAFAIESYGKATKALAFAGDRLAFAGKRLAFAMKQLAFATKNA
jgi:hypothetical protein